MSHSSSKQRVGLRLFSHDLDLHPFFSFRRLPHGIDDRLDVLFVAKRRCQLHRFPCPPVLLFDHLEGLLDRVDQLDQTLQMRYRDVGSDALADARLLVVEDVRDVAVDHVLLRLVLTLPVEVGPADRQAALRPADEHLLLVLTRHVAVDRDRRARRALELHLEAAEVVARHLADALDLVRLASERLKDAVHFRRSAVREESDEVDYYAAVHVKHATAHQLIADPVEFVLQEAARMDSSLTDYHLKHESVR